MPTNVTEIDKFAISNDCDEEYFVVELIEDYYTKDVVLAARGAITFVSHDDEIWSLGILEAEDFHKALGEAIESAKAAVSGVAFGPNVL